MKASTPHGSELRGRLIFDCGRTSYPYQPDTHGIMVVRGALDDGSRFRTFTFINDYNLEALAMVIDLNSSAS